MAAKLIVVGAAGRMGKRIISLAADDSELKIAGAVEMQGHPDIGKDAGTVAGIEPVGVKIGGEFAAGADVVIDFSLPAVANATVEYCTANKTALVLGTTGLSSEQRKKIESAGDKIAVIYGTNMSVGMNVLFSLVGRTASMLGEDYDIEIVEQHHRFKKDAPSGSALTLAENICKETGKDFDRSIVVGRAGKDATRQKGTIGIHAVRAGDIVGKHDVIFSTLGETVTLAHSAHSRDAFASGAIRAAKWLIGRKPGIYRMSDVLGLS
jgi:4-hydroxy-tetrahydrodipicolinate reductase